jgi:hypothetical protein
MMQPQITFEEYKQSWLEKEEITPNLNTLEKGRRFAIKLLTEYYEIPEDEDNIFQIDGSGDGGIDIAYLAKADMYEEDLEIESGDTWYIVQSKFGSSYSGFKTLLPEAQKIFNTIQGFTQNLSSSSKSLVEKINSFLTNKGDKDKLILIFATDNGISNETDRQALRDIEQTGKNKFGNFFEVKSISIYSIYEKSLNKPEIENYTKAPLKAKLINPADGSVLAGAVKLTDLYDFLKSYKSKANGDLDKIYDKNIRKFLGNRGKINQAMGKTLLEHPENFGLYNNGITIIVRNWNKAQNDDNVYVLHDPNIVNGCQTVTTIWDVLNAQDNSGGTGEGSKQWREKFNRAIVIVKIAKVFEDDELIENITRYTNSQNAIKDKDFIALNSDFSKFKKDLADKHKVFLEIHRGSWALQLALQAKKPNTKPFFIKESWANVFDLIKVYGAGWLGKAGDAINQNSLFVPKGRIFNEIMNQEDGFGVDDLLAAFHLLKKTESKEVKAKIKSMKFCFYHIFIELLKPIIVSIGKNQNSNFVITQSILRLVEHRESFDILANQVVMLLETYLNSGHDNSYANEPYMLTFQNFNTFIKNSRLLNDKTYSPILFNRIEFAKYAMKEQIAVGIPPKFDIIKDVLKSGNIHDAPINSAIAYVNVIDELKYLAKPKLTWKEICIELNIEVGNGSAREVLKRWVKKNQPQWYPVP